MTSRRLLLAIWMFSTSFVLSPIFSGLMISMLSVESKPADFIQSISDLKKFPDVKVMFQEGSLDVNIFQSSKIPVFVEAWKRCQENKQCIASFETQNSPDYLDPVANQENVLIGVYWDALLRRIFDKKKSCRFKLSEPYWASFSSFVARKQLNWKIVNMINIGMLRAYEGYLFSKWELASNPIELCFREDVSDPTISSFTLDKLVLAFNVLLFGLGFSVLALAFEFIYYKYSTFN